MILILPGRGVKFKFVPRRELLLDDHLLLFRWVLQHCCLTSCDIYWIFRPTLEVILMILDLIVTPQSTIVVLM